MELGLNGQRAVIAGGSRGIGRAIAIGFAAEGRRYRSVPVAPRLWNQLAPRSRRMVARSTPRRAICPTPPPSPVTSGTRRPLWAASTS